VPEDRAELREESKVLIAGGAITRNELRKRHGMEELAGSKGEELVQASGLRPASLAGARSVASENIHVAVARRTI